MIQGSLMLIQDQFCTIQNLQMSHNLQASFLVWTFFGRLLQQTGSSQKRKIELIQRIRYFLWITFSILVHCVIQVSELWNSNIVIDCYLVSTLLRTVLKVQVNHFQKNAFCLSFCQRILQVIPKFLYILRRLRNLKLFNNVKTNVYFFNFCGLLEITSKYCYVEFFYNFFDKVVQVVIFQKHLFVSITNPKNKLAFDKNSTFYCFCLHYL